MLKFFFVGASAVSYVSYFFFFFFFCHYLLFISSLGALGRLCFIIMFLFFSSRKHTYLILTLFYIVKPGFTGVNILAFISAQKHRL